MSVTTYIPFEAGDQVHGSYMGEKFSGTVISHRHDTMNHRRRHLHVDLHAPITVYGSERDAVYFSSLDSQGKDGTDHVERMEA